MPVRPSTQPAAKNRSVPARINRRLTLRYPGGAASGNGVDVRDGFLFRRALVYDVSQGGIALILTKPLTRGEDVCLQVTNNILAFSYDLDAQVRHVTPFANGCWMVGLAFPRELTLAELASLR
jgi:hypothetical protein